MITHSELREPVGICQECGARDDQPHRRFCSDHHDATRAQFAKLINDLADVAAILAGEQARMDKLVKGKP